MKRFRCGEVVPGCTAVFDCPSDSEILSAVAVHARESHGITEISEGLVATVRSLIQEAPQIASR